MYDVGLEKEARQIWQFEFRILTLLASEEGSNVDSRLANCLYNLAVSDYDEGRFDEAISLAERAAEINRRLGEPFIPLLANILSLLSDCFRRGGPIKKAEKPFQESTDLIRELASNDLLQFGWQMAKCLRDKAYLQLELGNYQKAIDCCGEAVQWLYKSSPRFKVEFPFDYYEIQWLRTLAYSVLGNLEEAIEFGREAATIYSRLICERPEYYINDDWGNTLPSWLFDLGRIQDVIDVLDEKLTVYCSVEPSFAIRKRFATILYERADFLYSYDRFADALNAVSQVIDVFRHLLEEDESDDDSFQQLLDGFNLHYSCLISLHRPSDAMQTIETVLDMLWPSLVEVGRNGHLQSDILKDLAQKELTIKKLQSNEDACNLKKYRVLSTIDNAILFWRQRECSSSNLINLLRLRFDILKRIEKPDADFLIIKETVDWYRRKLDSDIFKESLGSLIKLLSSSAEFLEQWGFVDNDLIFLKNSFKYVKLNINFSFHDITNLNHHLVTNLIRRKKQLVALEALNVFENIIRPIIDGQTCYSSHCLADILDTRSQCYSDLGGFVEALQDAKEVVELCRYAMSKCEEDDWRHNNYLAKALHAYARVLFALKDFDGALKPVEEAIQLNEKFKFDNFEDTRSDLIELRAETFNRLRSSADVKDVVPYVEDIDDKGWVGEMYALLI